MQGKVPTLNIDIFLLSAFPISIQWSYTRKGSATAYGSKKMPCNVCKPQLLNQRIKFLVHGRECQHQMILLLHTQDSGLGLRGAQIYVR